MVIFFCGILQSDNYQFTSKSIFKYITRDYKFGQNSSMILDTGTRVSILEPNNPEIGALEDSMELFKINCSNHDKRKYTLK